MLSDFHLFSELKNWLGNQCFQTKPSFQLQNNVQVYLISLTITFFDEGIEKLIHQYDQYLKLIAII
jgi:hypothetical protein